jgi:hypothetical protein
MPNYTPYKFKSLIVTTYKIKSEEGKTFDDLNYGDKVTFEESSPNGAQAVFVKGIESLDGKGKSFRADFVPQERAAKYTELFKELNQTNKKTSPLFCVHGFNVQPDDVLENMSKAYVRFNVALNYFPIPVVWPCNTEGDYTTDQDMPSLGAGLHLNALVRGIDDNLFPRKSLLMHSMGNHVIFDGACGTKDDKNKVINSPPEIQFENIFMVAADLPKDIFWKEPYDYDGMLWDGERYKRIYGQKKQKASNFFGMLQTVGTGADKKPKGKIYVVHQPLDKALLGSATTNNEQRLGSYGYMKDGADKIRDEFKGYLENYNIRKDLPWYGDDPLYGHSYQFEKVAIQYYFSKDLAE